jgi:type VI secretion system protein VasD
MKIKLSLSLAVCLLVSACTSITSKITAGPNINPDINNTPSPVALSIFELSAAPLFQGTDFFSLYANAGNSLGSTLLYEKNVMIVPGQSLSVSVPCVKGAHYLGYIVAFRNLNNIAWRGLVAINPKPVLGQDINVIIDSRGLHVQAVKVSGATP